jgi:hypothetical protein
MGFYDNLKDNVVIPKIIEFGKPITLKKINATSYNPVTGVYDDDSFTSDSGYGLQTNYNNKDIDGTNIKIGDKELLAVEIAEPSSNDKIVIDSVEYDVINVSEVKPGTVNMFYRIQIRK